MRATPFLAYPVDEDGPWAGLGRYARSLEAMPCGLSAGGQHVFFLVGLGVREADLAQLEASLGEHMAIATVHYDRVTQRWEAQGIMDDEQLRASCLGPALEMAAFDVPWVHADNRGAWVRLVPVEDPDLFVLHARLEKALGRPVTVSYLDFAEYQQWLRRLQVVS